MECPECRRPDRHAEADRPEHNEPLASHTLPIHELTLVSLRTVALPKTNSLSRGNASKTREKAQDATRSFSRANDGRNRKRCREPRRSRSSPRDGGPLQFSRRSCCYVRFRNRPGAAAPRTETECRARRHGSARLVRGQRVSRTVGSENEPGPSSLAASAPRSSALEPAGTRHFPYASSAQLRADSASAPPPGPTPGQGDSPDRDRHT